jgi:preprotein translocase subunit SecG
MRNLLIGVVFLLSGMGLLMWRMYGGGSAGLIFGIISALSGSTHYLSKFVIEKFHKQDSE